jgi:16S rRNA (uracil1498-N3)-methyltransferase
MFIEISKGNHRWCIILIMKNLPRFYIKKENIKRKRFLLEDERVVRHMGLVLRLKKGDGIELFDGEGKEYKAIIGFLTKKQAAGVVESESVVEIKDKLFITLAQSLPRAGKLDSIIKMNTEVGVQKFIFFESEFSVAKMESMTEQKMNRLHKVALEALRQSEGNITPIIGKAVSYKEIISTSDYDLKLLLHSRDTKGSKSLSEIKKDIKTKMNILVLIGPEGGFSDKEISMAKESDCKIVFLDLPILRIETAGVVVTSNLLMK